MTEQPKPYPAMKTTRRARNLRREQTTAERRLWSRLRDGRLGGIKFRRQYPIAGFIADFCCVELRLVIELDGGQHAESVEYDARRTQIMQRAGYRVLRFWDNEVLTNTDGVLIRISQNLNIRASE